MRRTILAVLLTLQTLFAFAANADEARLAWRIIQSSGETMVSTGGIFPVALDPKAPLPNGTVVSTGPSGRMMLRRGGEQIALGPLSSITLTDGTNLITRIRQNSGSVWFNVGKRTAPHFEVDTPYLAAIVKGTTFTVTIDDGGSTVAVQEGTVEVATDSRSAVTLVKRGRTARVLRGSSSQIEIVNGGKTERIVAGHDGSWDSNGPDDHGGTPAPGTPDRSAATSGGEAPLLRSSNSVQGVSAVAASFVNGPASSAASQSASVRFDEAPALRGSENTPATSSPIDFPTGGTSATAGISGITLASLRSQGSTAATTQHGGVTLQNASYALRQTGSATIYTATQNFSAMKDTASRAAGDMFTRVDRSAKAQASKARTDLPLREIGFGLAALLIYMLASHILGLRRRLKTARTPEQT
ncbi:MAG: FecR domain-containing protein [Alphaproteobacteria bacterium]|nr:FecR domain-containing protein [Alphaproteobacteria bacterium]